MVFMIFAYFLGRIHAHICQVVQNLAFQITILKHAEMATNEFVEAIGDIPCCKKKLLFS